MCHFKLECQIGIQYFTTPINSIWKTSTYLWKPASNFWHPTAWEKKSYYWTCISPINIIVPFNSFIFIAFFCELCVISLHFYLDSFLLFKLYVNISFIKCVIKNCMYLFGTQMILFLRVACTCKSACTCVYLHVEVRGQPWASFLTTLILILLFQYKVSFWKWSSYLPRLTGQNTSRVFLFMPPQHYA